LAKVVTGLENQKLERHGSDCTSCAEAKSTRASFGRSSSSTQMPLDLLHIDLAGPSRTASIGGGLYILVIVDDYSGYYHAEILRSKSETFDKFFTWLRIQEVRLERKAKVIRSDNGGEFTSNQWKEYCRTHGIRHETTTAYTPEQNGKAERSVRTLKEGCRTFLIEAALSDRYWAFAVKAFCWVRNMTLTSVSRSQTPYQRFYSKIPDVGNLRIFGCVAFVHINKHERQGAFSPKARKVVFVGYNQEQGSKNWMFYDPYNRKVIESCHARFWESAKWNDKQVDPDMRFLEEDIIADFPPEPARREDEDDEEHGPEDEGGNALPQGIRQPEPLAPEQNNRPAVPEGEIRQNNAIPPRQDAPQPNPVDGDPEGPPLALRRGVRERRPPGKYWENPQRAQHEAYITHLDQLQNQPKVEEILERAYQIALESDESEDRFHQAKLLELDSMSKNEVWELVPPTGRKPIGSCWVCTDKLLADGNTKEKARLVAQGYTQVEGVDYQEIFAPVIKMESVRIILSLIALLDMEFIQGDVKTAFLYERLKEGEDVYMKQPPGFLTPGKEQWVCKLKKAIYGLHQSPGAFYRHI
jgi:transposase InsO family protein